MPLAMEPPHPAYAADRACAYNEKTRRWIFATRWTLSALARSASRCYVYHIWWPLGTDDIHRTRGKKIACSRSGVCDWLVPT